MADRGGIKLISTSASPILGTPNSMTSDNAKIKAYIGRSYERGIADRNVHTHQMFIPEKTASPHPRFLGLAQSIYERRGK